MTGAMAVIHGNFRWSRQELQEFVERDRFLKRFPRETAAPLFLPGEERGAIGFRHSTLPVAPRGTFPQSFPPVPFLSKVALVPWFR